MSVYNGQRYLKGCLESILRQTFSDYEFIIVNDGSTDDTVAILGEYESDARFVLIHNTKNIGLTKSLNKALRKARGQFIARMDADDLSLPDRLAKQHEFLLNSRDTGVVGSNYYEIDEDGGKRGEIILPETDDDIRRKIMRMNPFNHGAVMMRGEALETVGLYNERFRYAQDYELWYRMLKQYKGHNLQEKLLMKRNPVGSITVSKKRKQIAYTLWAIHKGRKLFEPTIADRIHYAKYMMIYCTPQCVLKRLRTIKTRARKHYYTVKL